MKPAQTSTATIITNQAQRELIESLQRKHLEDGGAIFAQVYHDGLRIRTLTPKQTSDLAEAFSRVLGVPMDSTFRNSAFHKKDGAA